MIHKIKSTIKFLTVFIFALLCLFYGYRMYLKSAYPLKFYDHISEACEKYGVEKALVLAVVRTESKFNSAAVSNAGAVGLMQLMPETFDWLQSNLQQRNKKNEVFLTEPKINIDYGTYLLSILANKYVDETVMLCAYNAGIGKIDKWLNDPRYSDDKITLKKIPYKETRNYVVKVKKSKKIYQNLYF